VRWRWLQSPDASGAEQMAVDTGLLTRARETGESVFRVYGWARPTLSFGRHETVVGRFDAARLDAGGFDAVRRPTGGRVLLHDGELTYSVTAPAGAGSLREDFDAINRLLAAALRALGVAVAVAAPGGRERRPGTDACFAAPSAGELVSGEAKLVASAQRRDAGAILQHGSIILVDRQHVIPSLAAAGFPAPMPAASVSQAAGRVVERAEVCAALRTALEAAHGAAADLPPTEANAWAEPHVAQFADPRWTWRR
jgi:lipoate-protein ligase A